MKTEGTNGTSIINTINVKVDENSKIKSTIKGSQIKIYDNPREDFAKDNMDYIVIKAFDTEYVKDVEEMNA